MDNYIERDYLQYRILEECESPNLTKEADEMLSTIYGLVINAPSCNAEPVIHAHWIHDFIDADWNCGVEIHCGWICSHCGGYAEMESKTPYCPFCGAKMDEVQDG